MWKGHLHACQTAPVSGEVSLMLGLWVGLQRKPAAFVWLSLGLYASEQAGPILAPPSPQ